MKIAIANYGRSTPAQVKPSAVSGFSTLNDMFRVAGMKKYFLLFLSLIAGFQGLTSESSSGRIEGDNAFYRLADDYIAGYLAWRPQTGTALGFHQYDGKVTDFSRQSLDVELARLHRFDEQLGALNTNGSSAKAFY